MSRLHILIVSDQLLGNLIPTLMRCPEQVALIVTPSMRDQARRLTALLEERGIIVQRFEDAPDVDLSKLQEFALDVIAKLSGQAEEIELNLTGGTKLMAIGFLEVLRSEVDRCVYTDTAHGRLELLPIEGQDKSEPPQPLNSVLDVSTYLRAQGFQVRRIESDDVDRLEQVRARKSVCKDLAQRAADWGDVLGMLNDLASKAMRKDDLVEPNQMLDKAPHGRWEQALGWLASKGMLGWEGGAEVDFLDPERTRFLNGGWLEEYVYHRLVDEGVDDVALSVTGTWEGTEGARNEFDVVAVHRNHLLVVECKTNKHGRDEAADDKQFYKLNSLSQGVRGLFGRTWFVTARRAQPHMEGRAKQHDIEIIGPDRLPRLRNEVRQWMEDVAPRGV